MSGQWGSSKEELAGAGSLGLLCVCEGGLEACGERRGIRAGQCSSNTRSQTCSGHGWDNHELGNKARSGRNSFKERFHGLLSVPSSQRYLSVTIYHKSYFT